MNAQPDGVGNDAPVCAMGFSSACMIEQEKGPCDQNHGTELPAAEFFMKDRNRDEGDHQKGADAEDRIGYHGRNLLQAQPATT